MLKHVSRIGIAAIAVVAMPIVSEAATLVLNYDQVEIASNAGFTANFTSLPIPAGGAISVPNGYYFRFGVRATVTANPNSPGAIANGVENGYTQPANLGVAAFGATVGNSSPTLLAPRAVGGSSTATVNQFFVVATPGSADTTTGIVGTTQLLSGGIIGSNVSATNAAQRPRLTIGANTVPTADADDLFTTLAYRAALTGSGVVTLTPSIPSSSIGFIIVRSDGDTANAVPPTYDNRTFSGTTDSFTGLNPFLVTVGTVPEPASVAVLGLGALGVLARRRKA